MKLLETLGKKLQHCTFATTNYDLLIEISANMLGLKYDYNNALLTKNANLKILKLHGSPNIWPDLGSGSINNITWRDATFNRLHHGPVKVVSIQEINRSCRKKHLGPVMAEYHQDKRTITGGNFTDNQIALWKEALKKASKCFIVGLRLNTADKHIWGPIESSKCNVYYYSPDENRINEILDWKRGRNIYPIEETFEGALRDIIVKLKL